MGIEVLAAAITESLVSLGASEAVAGAIGAGLADAAAGAAIGGGIGGLEAGASGGNVLKGMEKGGLGGALTGGTIGGLGGVAGDLFGGASGALGGAAPVIGDVLAGAGGGTLGGLATGSKNLALSALEGGGAGLTAGLMGGGSQSTGGAAPASADAAPAVAPPPGSVTPAPPGGGGIGASAAAVSNPLSGTSTFDQMMTPASNAGYMPGAVTPIDLPTTGVGTFNEPPVVAPSYSGSDNSQLGMAIGQPTTRTLTGSGHSTGFLDSLLSPAGTDITSAPSPGAVSGPSNLIAAAAVPGNAPLPGVAGANGWQGLDPISKTLAAGSGGGQSLDQMLQSMGSNQSASLVDAGPVAQPGAGAGSASTDVGQKMAKGITGNSTLDSILGKGIDIIPSAGLMGASVLMGQQPVKGMNQLKSAAEAQMAQAQGLIDSYQSGNLPAGLKQALTSAGAAAKASIQSQYAARGASGSSAEEQDLAAVDQRMAAQGGQMLQNLLNQGLSSEQAANGLYSELLNVNLKQDTALSGSMANFAASLAGGGSAPVRAS